MFSCGNCWASLWSVATWLIPNANAATNGICRAGSYVIGVLDGRAPSATKKGAWLERLCLLCALVGTASAMDGSTNDTVDDDDIETIDGNVEMQKPIFYSKSIGSFPINKARKFILIVQT